jgi:hypothetical protein
MVIRRLDRNLNVIGQEIQLYTAFDTCIAIQPPEIALAAEYQVKIKLELFKMFYSVYGILL